MTEAEETARRAVGTRDVAQLEKTAGTPETAPADTPILVWVREANRDGSGAWRMGRVARGSHFADQLFADGYNGPWDIPFWHPLPPPAEQK